MTTETRQATMARAVRLHVLGSTLAEIAAETGVSSRTVRRWLAGPLAGDVVELRRRVREWVAAEDG